MSILKGGTQTVNYLSFDGVNDFAQINISIPTSGEIEMTMATYNDVNENDFYLSSGDTTPRFYFYNWEDTTTIVNNFTDTIYDTNFNPNDGEINNYRFEWTSSSYSVYINDNLVNTSSISFNSPSDSPLYIGKLFNNTFYGEFDLYYLSIRNGSGNLIHEYTFNEGSGNTVQDNIGNADMSLNGATWQTETVSPAIKNIYYGQPNNYLSFDGSNDYVNVPHTPITGFPRTVSARVYLDSSASGRNAIIESYNFTNIGSSWNAFAIEINDGLLRSFVDENGGQEINYNVPSETWLNITSVVDNGKQELWVNGVLVASDNLTNLDFLVPQGFNIGTYRSANARFFEGDIDNVSIFNTDLSASTIQSMHSNNLTLNGNENNLVAYYNFNEGSGTTLQDTSGNNYDGTIIGATWETEEGSNEVSKVYLGSDLIFTQVNAQTQQYSYSYLDGSGYEGPGNFRNNLSAWQTTTKIDIINDSIILDSITDFFIISFWDSNDNYIGFKHAQNQNYLPSGWTPYYLGTVQSTNISIPSNAGKFVLQTHKINYSDGDGSVIGVNATTFQNNTIIYNL